MSKVLVMAGGTGGHIIPALAVAKLLIEKGMEVSWIGAHNGLEQELVQQAKIPFDGITVRGIRHSGFKRKLTMPFMLFTAIYQSFKIFRKRKPFAVLGMGGFVAGPGGLMAILLRVPLVLHEQNTVAGMTNRWLSGFSRANLTGFPQAQGIERFEWIGNPVRESILALPDPVERLSKRTGALRILVIGGSQGAKAFNDYLPGLLGHCSSDFCEVRHQCGKGIVANIQERYRIAGVDAKVTSFIDDMADAYGWADVVICRSGAMTVSEVCAAGVVAIFIPYPHAVNDHQTKNAEYLVSQKSAFCIKQEDFVKGGWIEILARLSQDRVELSGMALEARSLSKPDATLRAARTCMEVIHA